MNIVPSAAGSIEERSQVNQWVAFVATELHKTFSSRLFQAKGAESTKQASRGRLGHFAELDMHLAKRPYLRRCQGPAGV
ncbi:MAG: glutathione transferase GstA [Microvirga sp.]|jgi:glutathione S-transferase|nr:glutathione transferase GstA [Microvirga sp.]